MILLAFAADFIIISLITELTKLNAVKNIDIDIADTLDKNIDMVSISTMAILTHL